MTEEQILKAIANACDDSTLWFQIIVKERTLHVYINRPGEAGLDYQQLESKIYDAVNRNRLGKFQELALYCRVLGQVEPDWQSIRAIETVKTVETDAEFSSMMSAITGAVEVTNSIVDRIERELTTPESFSSDPWGDFDDIPTTADGDRQLKPEELESIDDAVLELDLKKYCFISNQRLLYAELTVPQEHIARLIDTFDRFESSVKRSQLPTLELYFEQSTTPDLSDLNSEVQIWWTEVATLNSIEQKLLAIWLSRYCLHPEATATIIRAVLPPQFRSNKAIATSALKNKNAAQPISSTKNSQYQSGLIYSFKTWLHSLWSTLGKDKPK